MKRIDIKKNGVVVFSSGNLPEGQAEAWLSEGLTTHTFGKPAVYESVKNETTGEFEQVLVTPAEAFEIVHVDVTAEVAKQDRIKALEAVGEADRAKCAKALKVIGGFNRERLLTAQQISDMQALFADTEKALNAGRPDLAHALISAIAVDDVLVTQEMKDICLEILS